MIRFWADNHYNTHAGKVIFDHLPAELKAKIRFAEDDWRELEEGSWTGNCTLLVLHLIGGTCGIPHPGPGAEKAVKRYCEQGGNLLLLHGSSAAFWQWAWWRALPGLRWVRPNDPDGIAPSTHPHAPCKVERAKVRSALAAKLQEFELPEDEIYTSLEQVSPVTVLMTACAENRSWPQCCETVTPWGGRIVSFIPGHKAECTSNPALIADVTELIRELEK